MRRIRISPELKLAAIEQYLDLLQSREHRSVSIVNSASIIVNYSRGIFGSETDVTDLMHYPMR